MAVVKPFVYSDSGVGQGRAHSSAMDFRYALRSLRKNPGFTLLAVLVMALGIGANTAVFSVVNSVLLKPLDYRDPDRIVTVGTLWKNGGQQGQVSAPDFHDWHDQSTAFSALAYYAANETAVRAGSTAEYGRIAAVTPEFFAVFDVQPSLGRLFTAEEQQPRSSAAAIISYSFWQSHFAGKPEALGQTIGIQDKTLSIVGVMPPRFQFPNKTDLWYPANTIFSETTSRSAHNYLVAGRLKPDVKLEQAQAQVASIAARLEKLYPPSNRNKSAIVTRMSDVRTTLYLLLGAVGVVLLIACANMANLLLAKSTSRTREIAIRAAVGASRGRIVRQLVTESLVLAAVSGLAGLMLALWGSNALVLLAPKNVPRLAETAIDGWVLAFTLGISVVASLLFGLAPALHASKVDLSDTLKRGAARAVGGGGAGRMRAALVVAEIALSVMLLAGAGLLVKSFVALQNVALGFRPENVVVMSASVPATDVETARRAGRFYQDLIAQVAAIPGVSAVSASRTPPGRVSSNGGYWVDHEPRPEELTVAAPQAVFSIVASGAFTALGIPLKTGRDFLESDAYDAPFSAIINEALARKTFPGQNPVGHTIYWGFDSLKEMRIVGVVGDVRQPGPARQPSPEIFAPYQQHPRAGMAMSLMVRTSSDPAAFFETLRRKAREISPDVPVKFTTMESRLSENVATPRFRTLLLGIFAGLAVCLAMAGVYGVMAYVVGQRSAEIGLRMAMGASPMNVMGMVLRQGLALAAIGLAIGLAGAVAATRLLTGMLFEVKPGDPMTYAGVTVLLAVVALAATYIPARRATKVDPLVALRQE
jgi:putative ABC transport system permease protein